jgi:hypothetical protein
MEMEMEMEMADMDMDIMGHGAYCHQPPYRAARPSLASVAAGEKTPRASPWKVEI